MTKAAETSNPFADIEKSLEALKTVPQRPHTFTMSREMYDALEKQANTPPTLATKAWAFMQSHGPVFSRRFWWWVEGMHFKWWDFRIKHGWVKEAEK